MDFVCNNHSSHFQGCCSKSHPQPISQPSIECLKALSVICSKSVQKVAELRLFTVQLGIDPDTAFDLISFNVTANPNEIVMRGTLIEGKVVNSGFVPITATINIVGEDTPIVASLNLPFQAETECPGACPGDDLQETVPVIEAVLEPVITPVIAAISGTPLPTVPIATVTFKVIIRTQITVSREKLVQAGVTVLEDINPDRCVTVQPTTPTARTTTFFNGV
jgi:hypothetical protein